MGCMMTVTEEYRSRTKEGKLIDAFSRVSRSITMCRLFVVVSVLFLVERRFEVANRWLSRRSNLHSVEIFREQIVSEPKNIVKR